MHLGDLQYINPFIRHKHHTEKYDHTCVIIISENVMMDRFVILVSNSMIMNNLSVMEIAGICIVLLFSFVSESFGH